jgi:hypothetical protein
MRLRRYGLVVHCALREHFGQAEDQYIASSRLSTRPFELVYKPIRRRAAREWSVVKTPWWRSLLWLLGIVLRVFAPLMALGWPALAIYGALSPNPSDIAALKLGRLETAILVGVAGGGAECDERGCVAQPWHRSYIVFPRLLVRPSGFTVEDGQDSPRLDELAGGALFVIAAWAACVWGTWMYWVRPSRTRPGGSLKRT